MKKTILVYGCTAGSLVALGLFLSMTLKDKISLDQGMYIGFAMMILSLSLIYFAVRQYRDQDLGGSIGFGKAFGMGLAISFLASAFYVAAWMVVYRYYLPNFMVEYTRYTLQQYQSAGLDAATLARKTKELMDYKEQYEQNPWFRAGITFTEMFPVGALVSLICAFLLKRKRAAQ